MSEYIKADAVEKIINDIRDCFSVKGYWAILERLKKIPTADVRENVHGGWVYDYAYYDEGGCPCVVTRCNQCGEPNPVSNFCPNCGADMRGEENEK